MSIVVTGATGHLGRLVVESLIERGVPEGEIVAAGRSVDRIADLAERGVRVAHIDYDDPAGLAEAFKGVDKALVVSGTDFGKRVEQHLAAARAAVEGGARSIAYTSILGASSSSLLLAGEHQGTEAGLATIGVPVTLLRNGWYHENYTAQIPTYVQHGAVVGSAGGGLVSAAARADLAAAAAAVLTGEGHEGKTYELGGEPFTLSDLAAAVTEISGTKVVYSDVPQQQYASILESAGLPAPVAAVFADSDRGIRAGELHTASDDLARLVGRPLVTLRESVAAALA